MIWFYIVFVGEILQLKLKLRSFDENRKKALNKIIDIKGSLSIMVYNKSFLCLCWKILSCSNSNFGFENLINLICKFNFCSTMLYKQFERNHIIMWSSFHLVRGAETCNSCSLIYDCVKELGFDFQAVFECFVELDPSSWQKKKRFLNLSPLDQRISWLRLRETRRFLNLIRCFTKL